MRYLVCFFLLLACCPLRAPANENCNEVLTSIEQEARLLKQDLEIALSLLKGQSQKLSEMQSVIDNSKKTIERLQKKLDDSAKITAALKSSYQERLRDLKSLVEQLQMRLAEANKLNASFGSIESETWKTIDAVTRMRDLIAATGVGLAAGTLGWEFSQNGWVTLGSGLGAWLLTYGVLRIIF